MTLDDKLNKPLIVSVGITGAITTRQQLPWLPCTPREIAQSAVEAAQAGAAIVHIHVREADGTPSARTELYRETFDRIREKSDVLICATTGSGGGLFSEQDRLNALPLETEIASLDCGSMNFGERIFENPPHFLRTLAREITSRRIVPEIECFELGMVQNVRWLQKEGLLPGPTERWWFQFCLGVKGGAPCDAQTLLAMRALLPEGAEWSVLGIGRGQLPVNLMAILEGGHVRTGVEDNIYYRKGQLARSNAQLVERVVELAAEVGRPIATVEQTRALLGCKAARPRKPMVPAAS